MIEIKVGDKIQLWPGAVDYFGLPPNPVEPYVVISLPSKPEEVAQDSKKVKRPQTASSTSYQIWDPRYPRDPEPWTPQRGLAVPVQATQWVHVSYLRKV